MKDKVAVFPEWGGYKIKFNGKTIGAVPGGRLEMAKDRAKQVAITNKIDSFDILNEAGEIIETVKIDQG